MRAQLCLSALVLVVGLAACGDDDGATEPAPARAQAERPASAHPAGDPALARRCGLAPSRYEPVPAGVVPDGLLPEGAQLASGGGDAAVAHVPLAVPAALRALEANARSLGYAVDFSENENFEAELVVSDGPEKLELRLKAADRCPKASTLNLQRESE